MSKTETANPNPIDTEDVRDRVLDAMDQLNENFVQREDAVLCIVLALTTLNHFGLFGDPGTAKTALTKCAFKHVGDAKFFKVLCGAFATEDKIFGPTDIKGFQQGKWGRCTEGRLAWCTHGYLDEIFKSNDGCVNGILEITEERTYEGDPAELCTMGCSSNWPEVDGRSPVTNAVWDRILLRCIVNEVDGEEEEIRMLELADKHDQEEYVPESTFTVEELRTVSAHIQKNVKIRKNVRTALRSVRLRLVKEKVKNSGRRVGRLQHALKAAAWLDGRDHVTLEDFHILKFGLWQNRRQYETVLAVLDTIDQDTVRDCVKLVDGALAEYGKLQGMDAKSRLQNAPNAVRVMKDSAAKVQALLRDPGATKVGRKRVAKSMDDLKTRFGELQAEVNKHVSGD